MDNTNPAQHGYYRSQLDQAKARRDALLATYDALDRAAQEHATDLRAAIDQATAAVFWAERDLWRIMQAQRSWRPR